MRTATFLLILLATGILPASADETYADPAKLEKLWRQQGTNPGYDSYTQQFTQYNNSLHLDTQDHCYELSPGHVTLYLVIMQSGYVEYVTPDVDNAKSACFRRTYLGLRVKVPPSPPFIMRMEF